MSAARDATSDVEAFLDRAGRSITFYARRYGISITSARSAFTAAWHDAQMSYDPARGASLDSHATWRAEEIIKDDRFGVRGDAMRRVSCSIDERADAGVEHIERNDVELGERFYRAEPCTLLHRAADRIRADLRVECVIDGLRRRVGKRWQQLARVVEIVADGGDRGDVMREYSCCEPHARKLIAAAAREIEGGLV